MRRLLSRLVGFSSLPLLAALIPFLALPVIARVGSVSDWAAVTVGQAIGGYASQVAFAGWNVLGTPLVAQEQNTERRLVLYARSFYVRLVVVTAIIVPAAGLAAVIAPTGGALVASLFTAAGALSSLGVSWFAVGVSDPRLIALYELFPRLLTTVASVPLILVSGQVGWYAVGLVCAQFAGLAFFHLRRFGRVRPPWSGWRDVRAGLISARAAWSVEMTGNLYASAPVPISTAINAPAAAASFASGDKIYRYGLLAVIAFGNTLQGWVLEVDGQRRTRRNSGAILMMVAVGLGGMLVLTFLGVPLSRLLFGEAVSTTPGIMLGYGVAYLAVASSTPLIRNVLIPARRERSVLVATVASAIVGLALMGVLGGAYGPVGVSAGLAVSETLTLAICGVLAAKAGLGGSIASGLGKR